MAHPRIGAGRDEPRHELRLGVVREIPVADLVVGNGLLVQIERVERRPCASDVRFEEICAGSGLREAKRFVGRRLLDAGFETQRRREHEPAEAHDVHHPLGPLLYYEQQKTESKQRASEFLASRMPKFLDYFERVLEGNGGRFLVGRRITYADLSLAQVLAGLLYAFPASTKRALRKRSRLAELGEKVFARPRIRRYLDSPRRLAFNNDDVFRRYPELGD